MNQSAFDCGAVLLSLNYSQQQIEKTRDFMSPELYKALASPCILWEEKERVINRVFPEETANFVKVITREGYLPLWQDIFDAYRQLCFKQQNILMVKIRTASRLSEDQLKRLKQALCRRFGCEDLALEQTLDSSLLGGIVVRIGDLEFDQSVKGRMKRLRNLIAG